MRDDETFETFGEALVVAAIFALMVWGLLAAVWFTIDPILDDPWRTGVRVGFMVGASVTLIIPAPDVWAAWKKSRLET